MGAAVFVRKWENRICLFGGGGAPSMKLTNEPSVMTTRSFFFWFSFLAFHHKVSTEIPRKEFFFSLNTLKKKKEPLILKPINCVI